MAFGKLTGINRTEADYYIIVIPQYQTTTYNLYNLDYYLIPVSKIKELIRDNKYTYMNNSQINNGYIFKVDVIKKNSKKL